MKLNECFVLREIKDKYFLVAVINNEFTNNLININEVAAKILILANEGHNVEKIIEDLSIEYNADLNRISVDVKSFIQYALENKILID